MVPGSCSRYDGIATAVRGSGDVGVRTALERRVRRAKTRHEKILLVGLTQATWLILTGRGGPRSLYDKSNSQNAGSERILVCSDMLALLLPLLLKRCRRQILNLSGLMGFQRIQTHMHCAASPNGRKKLRFQICRWT